MRVRLTNLFIIVLMSLFIISLSPAAIAQVESNCCCDPVTKQGLPEPINTCTEKGFLSKPLSTIGKTCSDICGSEVPDIITTDCGSPTFAVSPQNLTLRQIPGTRALRLTWKLPCATEYIEISRCKGETCTNPTQVALLPTTEQYIDESDDIELGASYKYNIIAKYVIQPTPSEPATNNITIGDLECFQQTVGTRFCISASYYSKYADYLTRFGYTNPEDLIPPVDKQAFTTDLEKAINQTFAPVFNKAYTCGSDGFLQDEAWSCKKDQTCVPIDAIKCAVKGQCDPPSELFGLTTTKTSCEGITTRKSCFYDRSRTNTNSCFACTSRMSCYDYRTKTACETDNCGVGGYNEQAKGTKTFCQWRDTFKELGTGVCVDPRSSNCLLCDLSGTSGSSNSDSYNTLFDACTEPKAIALGKPDDPHPCFFDPAERRALGCDKATCLSYKSQNQCNKQGTPIILGPINQILTPSKDPCAINVCEWNDQAGLCQKHANGDTKRIDCSTSDPACEADFFPPNTTIIPTGTNGRHDYLNIKVTDKTRRDITPAQRKGLTTYLCVKNTTQSCERAATFPLSTTTDPLIIKDLKLLDKQAILNITLADGPNTIFYYTIDSNRNKEIVKSVKINACRKCAGPILVGLNVSHSRFYGEITGPGNITGLFYTTDIKPDILLSLTDQSEIIPGTTKLTTNSTTAGLTASPTVRGYRQNHTFIASSQGSIITGPTGSLPDGRYTFTTNFRNTDSVLMDKPVTQEFIVDNTKPTLQVQPKPGSITEGKTILLNLTFSEKVIIKNITLTETEFINDFVKKTVKTDLTNLTESNDNTTWSTLLELTRDGTKTISVSAEDFAGNPYKADSTFIIGFGLPQIRLVAPRFGVAPTYTFNITAETSIPATCKWWLSPSQKELGIDSFDSLALFDRTEGTEHVQNAVKFGSIGSKAQQYLQIFCKTPAGTTQKTFPLSVDPEPPRINLAEIYPNPIIEGPPFEAGLLISIDKLGFCKYSTRTTTYREMENQLPGFGEDPRKSLATNITFLTAGTHDVKVACESRAGIVSPTTTTRVTIDPTVPLNVTNKTPPASNSTEFTLTVETNKQAMCYIGLQSQSLGDCIGSCTFKRGGHSTPIEAQQLGLNTFYVQCTAKGGKESTPEIQIKVIVDDSPPSNLTINATQVRTTENGTLIPLVPDEPTLTYFTDQLTFTVSAVDNETAVGKYTYRLETRDGKKVVNDTSIPGDKGDKLIIVNKDSAGNPLRLEDQTEYVFIVSATNTVGIESSSITSEGILIDTSKAPQICQNKLFDQKNETDTDCGNQCPSCTAGKKCSKNTDCKTQFCVNATKVCGEPSATDKIQNGDETDVDCGGVTAPKCPQDKKCIEDNDCTTNKCGENGRCVKPVTCDNGIQDNGETDEDCGDVCPEKCPRGDSCVTRIDCVTGLGCVKSKCDTCAADDLDCDGNPDPIICKDKTRNGGESDTDCGQVCPLGCGGDKKCEENTDCLSQKCINTKCIIPDTCSNGIKDGKETDTDCGSVCNKACTTGQGCTSTQDCTTDLGCLNHECRVCPDNDLNCDDIPDPSTCRNKKQDGSEVATDCAGPCGRPCGAKKPCDTNADCLSEECESSTACVVPDTCENMEKDGKETDTDCGSVCNKKCSPGERCITYQDCEEGVSCIHRTCTKCEEGDPACTDIPPEPAASCQNTRRDGTESDVDCGGECPSCPPDRSCEQNTDCASELCQDQRCQASSSCGNGKQDGNEADIDCGAPCNEKCQAGKNCNSIQDCAQGLTCKEGICKPCTPNAPGCAESTNNSDDDNQPKSRLWIWILIILLLILGAIGGYLWYDYQKKKPITLLPLPPIRTGPPNTLGTGLRPGAITMKNTTLRPFSTLKTPFRPGFPSKPGLRISTPAKPGIALKPGTPTTAGLKLAPSTLTPPLTTPPTTPLTTTHKTIAHKKTEDYPELKTKPPQKTHAKKDPFTKLSHIGETTPNMSAADTFAGLSAQEREALIGKLDQLRKGAVTDTQRNDIFKKLKVTSEWYKDNKDQLHKEAQRWKRK